MIRPARRALPLALIAALALGAPGLTLAAPGGASGTEKADSYAFAFKDAEIGQVAEEILGNALGLTYTVDPAVTGKMSFRIDKRLTRAQLLEAFEAALVANDVMMVRKGETLALMPRATAKASAGLRPAADGAGRAGYQVVAAPLSFAQPSEVSKAFEAIGQAHLVIYQNDKMGLLLLGGDGREIEAAMQTIHVFDHSGLEGSKIRWFELQQAPANTVAEELDKVLQTSGVSGVSVIPLKRLNGLFVLARTSQALDEIGGWVQRLDTPSREENASLWVYHPRNVRAEALGQTLNSVLSSRVSLGESSLAAGPSPTGSAAPSATASVQSTAFVASGDDAVRVGVDKETNTLLVSAPASRWIQIQKILNEVDRTPSQVLIEASILEVTLGNDFRFGVDWSVIAQSGKLTITSTGDKTGAVAPTFPGFAVTFLDDDIAAAVSALSSRTAVEIVSAPKVVALDNRTAKLQVGDQVPVVTQSSRSSNSNDAPLVTTTEYRSTGVILDVTPRISDDKVLLDVSQEVSSVAKTTTSGIDSPTIQQRRLQSTLMLQDGQTVALGGLISTNRSTGDSGVPWLKDIPAVGSLFKNESRDNRRTELIVLLSAKIMRDQSSSERVMADLLADMREVQSRGLLKH